MEKTYKHFYFIILGFVLLLAFVLRLKVYFLARPLWHDECSLALSILHRPLWDFFQPLEYSQKAPVLFMLLTKFFSYFVGVKELGLRLVPIVSSLCTIPVFYYLSKKLLTNKVSIVFANFLFAVNYQLINYSQEFKQYSFDVLIFMSAILLFSMFDITKASYKKCFLYLLISVVLVLSSFTSVFVVAGYIIYLLFEKTDLKKKFLFTLPILLGGGIYYALVLQKTQSSEVSTYLSYWQGGFLTFSLKNILLMIKDNFDFFFSPNKFVLFEMILFFWGLVLLIKSKTKNSLLVLLSLLFVLLASVLKIYPIWQRVALYLLPISILFLSLPLCLLSKDNKVKSVMILIFSIVCFSKYDFQYVYNFFQPDIFSRSEHPKELMQHLNKDIKKGDIVVVNNASDSEFNYYSSFYNIDNQVLMERLANNSSKEYIGLLNQFPVGNYWFYLANDYSHSPVIENILIWSKTKRIIKQYRYGSSYLIYVSVR